MNYTERAKQLGFSAAAVMDTKNLVFKPEYRVFCEENRCGNYDRNPACPPESGSVEEMKEHQVEKNIEQFLPYLLWVSGMAAGSKFQKDKETIRYITQILDRNCVA